MNIMKAFDSISHQILLSKMQNQFGIHDNELNWFTSYLTDREQQWGAGRGGTMVPPAEIFRGRQTTTGALKLCKTKFSTKTLKVILNLLKEIYAFRPSKLVVLMPE